MPLTKPHAKIIPAFAPSDKLLVSKYKMSGPGASVNNIDAVKKYKNIWLSNLNHLWKDCIMFEKFLRDSFLDKHSTGS